MAKARPERHTVVIRGGRGGGPYRKPARSSDPCPDHSNRLIDFAAWWRSWHSPRAVCVRPSGGHFSIDHLTALGRQVWDLAGSMMGRAPSHRGCNLKGAYLKWQVKDEADFATAAVLRDRLLDLGLDVVLTEPRGKRTVTLKGTRPPYRREVTVRYVKLTMA
jgi:hypothetical protein